VTQIFDENGARREVQYALFEGVVPPPPKAGKWKSKLFSEVTDFTVFMSLQQQLMQRRFQALIKENNYPCQEKSLYLSKPEVCLAPLLLL